MTKTAKTVVTAFLAGESKKMGNTETDGQKLFLYGNLIATKQLDGLYITNAGWPTNTTKDRLNCLPNVNINQKKGIWYLNDERWDGQMIKINNR